MFQFLSEVARQCRRGDTERGQGEPRGFALGVVFVRLVYLPQIQDEPGHQDAGHAKGATTLCSQREQGYEAAKSRKTYILKNQLMLAMTTNDG